MELTARLELAREALGQADEVPPNSPASLPLSSPQTSSPQTSLVDQKSETKERHHSRRRRNDDDRERHKQREQKRYKLRAEVEERLTEEINRQTQMGVVIATKQQSLERTRKRNQQAHSVIKDIQGELATTLRAQEKAEEELAQVKRKLQKYGGDVEAARQELAKAQEFIEQISHERDGAEEKAETARKEAREAVERMALEQAKAEGMILGRYEGVLAGWENGKYQGYTSARAKVLDEERQRIMQRRYELKEKYPQLDVDRAFDAVPSPDRSVDGLPLELLEKKAPISPPVFPNLPQQQHETTPQPHKRAHEPHRVLDIPRSTSPDTLHSELTPEPSPKPSSKPSAKSSKPRRERRRRAPSDPPPPPSSAPPIERKPRPKTHLPPPRPVFLEREDVSYHNQPPIEPDRQRPLGRSETIRKIFGGRKPSIDEGPQGPIPDVAPFAPSLPFPAFTTPLPSSRILEPMRGAMSPVPSMRVSPKFRARDVDPTPQQIAEKELRKMERQVAREKSKDKGVFGFMMRSISRSKAPNPGHRSGHQASASMSNVNLPASAFAPAYTRTHHASISNHSLPSQRQAQPQPQPSPKPSLARPLPSPRPSLRHNDLPDGFIPPVGPDGSISLPPPHGLRGAMDPAISREPSPTPSAHRSIHEHSRHNSGHDPNPSKRVIRGMGGSIRSIGGALKKGASVASHLSHRSSRSRSSSPNQDSMMIDPHPRSRANSFKSQRSMGFVPMTQAGLLLPEAIQVLPNEEEEIPVPQIDVVPAANPGYGRGRRRVPIGKSAMSTPMSQFSILDKEQGDRPSSQYHNSTKDALGLRLRQGSMSTDETLTEEPTMKSYPSIAGLSVITERSERGLSRSLTQKTHVRSPASTHQTPHVRRVPVPQAPEVHGLGAMQNEGYHGDSTSTTGHRRSEDDDDKPPEPPMKSPRTQFAAVYNHNRRRPAVLTVPAPLAPSQTPVPPPRGGYAGIGAGGGRRLGQGSNDVPEDATRPWTIPRRAEVVSPSGRVLVGLD